MTTVAAQKRYVRESLTRAFREMKAANSAGQQLPDAHRLFDELK